MYQEGQQISGRPNQGGGAFDSAVMSCAKKQHEQEIPEQIDRLGNTINQTMILLAELHTKLAPVMPPSSPEAIDNLSCGAIGPSTPLGIQLADFSRMAAQNNTSIRYLLDRIKL